MVREYYGNICKGEQVRQNLIALRRELKDEREKRSFAYLLAGDFSILAGLLGHEDPKVRKNAALILGEMESEDLLPVLFDAYKKEKTLFVRPDYLQAMQKLDYRPCLPALKGRLEALRKMAPSQEEGKHRQEEIRILQQMVMQYETPQRHRFTARDFSGEVILTANRCQREATAAQVETGRKTLLRGGVRVQGGKLSELLPIRTYEELLFPVEGLVVPDGRPQEIGRKLADGKLLDLVQRLHEGPPPFYYRLELKSTREPDRKGLFLRRIAEAFEGASGSAWINAPADYEMEIRLVQRRDGAYLVMVKLFTLQDRRFRYRREFTAASLAPVNAALAVELARPYLKKDAQILDPFCGTGTLLIERSMIGGARTMYGVDILEEAIGKARRNAELAGVCVNYINRDFFDFRHEYLFDEIITELPRPAQTRQREEIRELYLRFFDHALGLLADGAVMVLYCSEPEFAREGVRRHPQCRPLGEFLLSEKSGAELLVVRVQKEGR